MNERNKESLSALMDGEADELEVRRILNQLDSDDELRKKWTNYHLMGSLMRDESFDSIDLTQGINKALYGDSVLNTGDEVITSVVKKVTAKKPYAWYRSLTSVAVAASVTLAVLLGVQSIEPSDGLGLAEVSSRLQQGELTTSTLTLEEQQQLESAQQELQDYVLQHSTGPSAEQKGVLPFARVVEFQAQDK
jgi:sigma-E factor negative regulatory protein RseA